MEDIGDSIPSLVSSAAPLSKEKLREISSNPGPRHLQTKQYQEAPLLKCQHRFRQSVCASYLVPCMPTYPVGLQGPSWNTPLDRGQDLSEAQKL